MLWVLVLKADFPDPTFEMVSVIEFRCTVAALLLVRCCSPAPRASVT